MQAQMAACTLCGGRVYGTGPAIGTGVGMTPAGNRFASLVASLPALSDPSALSEKYGANINVAFFRHFRDEDCDSYLACSWLMEPAQVEDRGETSAPKRRAPLSLDQFDALAEANGVGQVYRALFELLSPHSTTPRRTLSTISFRATFDEGTRAFLSLYPGESSPSIGLLADVRPDLMAAALGVPEGSLQDALPPLVQGRWAYGEIRCFRSMEDIERLRCALEQGRAERAEDDQPES